MTSQTTNAPFLRRSLALATILTILAASTCAVTSAFAQGVHSPYSAMSGETLGVEYGEDSERYFGPSDFVLDAEGEYFYVVGLDSRALVRCASTAPRQATGSRSNSSRSNSRSSTVKRACDRRRRRSGSSQSSRSQIRRKTDAK